MEESAQNNNLKSIIWCILWALSMSLAMAAAKSVSKEISSLTLVFIRYLAGLIVFMPFVLREGTKHFKTNHPSLHLIRIVFSVIATLCTYYAYRQLPMAFATSIGFTGPLITTMLAIIILKDYVSITHWLLIITGYIGVFIMINPTNVVIDPAIFILLIANFAAGCSLITIKKLSETDSTLTIMLYSNIASTAILGIGAFFTWTTPTMHDLMFLAILGILGTFSQFAYTTALRYSNPSFLAPFEYSRLIFAAPIGYFLFEETPTVMALIGSLIIISSNYALARLRTKEN